MTARTHDGHDLRVEWAQVGAIVAAVTAVIGLQSFWIARALDGVRGEVDGLRNEMYRGFDRIDARFDRIEERQPPNLRRV